MCNSNTNNPAVLDLHLLSLGLRSLLFQAAQAAKLRGWHLYLVGGVVRDLLYFSHQLGNPAIPQSAPSFIDLDLVVDGYQDSGSVMAGVELAQSLHQIYPEAKLEIHGDFQTAALRWQGHPTLGSLEVDLATARTETYPYPAANPQVEASDLRADLYRRDFTINALALHLTPELLSVSGETQNENSFNYPDKNLLGNSPLVLDLFGGWQDLLDRQIRVLHSQSFIDDPTRIYRAVRFAVRLGFTIEPQTEGYIHTSIASGVYQKSLATQPKAPALQGRLKTEIKYILQAPYRQPALQLLGKLGGLKCLHPDLELDRILSRQIRLGDRLLRLLHHHQNLNFSSNPDQHNPHQDPDQIIVNSHLLPTDWQLRLELIIAALPPSDRTKVAQNLQLPPDSIARLDSLANAETRLAINLNQTVNHGIDRSIDGNNPEAEPNTGINLVTNLAVSSLVKRLEYYEIPLLLLVAIRGSAYGRRQVWQYFTLWSRVRSPLDGNHLKHLGYLPGRQYKVILEALLAATLDGLIIDYPSAVAFLKRHFPLGGYSS